MTKQEYIQFVERGVIKFLTGHDAEWQPHLYLHDQQLLEVARDDLREQSSTYWLGYVLGLIGSDLNPYKSELEDSNAAKVYGESLDFGRVAGQLDKANWNLQNEAIRQGVSL